MKILSFRKVRLGWELLLDGNVLMHRVAQTARNDIFLVATGVILTHEFLGLPLYVEGPLKQLLIERGYYKEKAPHEHS